jgi:CRISPR/Cas system-associated exonuclease Cas4 (RecB family)
MNEGEFPSSLPHHLVEDLLARRKLGLITPGHLESLEEPNFFSLILSPRRVILTRCPHSLREEAAESRFLTRLRLAGEKYRDPVAVATAADCRYREYRAGEDVSPLPEIVPSRGFFPGTIPEDLTLSATSTEMLLNCPVRFFFHLLGLDAPGAVREDLDPRSQGILLHSLAAACWELPSGEDGSSLEERLIELGGREIPSGPAFTELRLRLECGGWKRFARRVTEMLADWTPREWEEAVSEIFPWGKRRLRLHGRIDFIGTGAGGRIVVDFKRSGLPQKADVRKLNKPQLPFYSLCLKLRDIRVSHLGYCSFLTSKKGYLEMKEDGLIQRLIARIKAELSRAEEGGGYSCRPDEKYCRYCPYRGVCRFEELRAREEI